MYKKPEFDFVDPDTTVALNIGGQLFETTAAVLTYDPFSILAALCRKNPLFTPNIIDGSVYFDRDWWIFRHILAYLRSGALPSDIETLKELYSEASYYRIDSLRKAIENIPLDRLDDPHSIIKR
jgi:hypothetical protein